MKHILAHLKIVLWESYTNQSQQPNSPSPSSFIYLFHHGLKQEAYYILRWVLLFLYYNFIYILHFTNFTSVISYSALRKKKTIFILFFSQINKSQSESRIAYFLPATNDCSCSASASYLFTFVRHESCGHKFCLNFVLRYFINRHCPKVIVSTVIVVKWS